MGSDGLLREHYRLDKEYARDYADYKKIEAQFWRDSDLLNYYRSQGYSVDDLADYEFAVAGGRYRFKEAADRVNETVGRINQVSRDISQRWSDFATTYNREQQFRREASNRRQSAENERRQREASDYARARQQQNYIPDLTIRSRPDYGH